MRRKRMKLSKVISVLAVGSFVVFSAGCAARQTVKPEATPDTTSNAAVVESTPVPTPVATVVPGMKYVIKKGDTLWAVSSMSKIYKDSFQWPLLYKSNRDQISDPDIIEVGQELDVRKDLTTEEKEDAIQKAKDTPPYKAHTAPRKTLPLKY
jgi:nucleoid-associated protein YgaU